MKLRLIALFVFCSSVANGLNASIPRVVRAATRTFTTNTTAAAAAAAAARAVRAHTTAHTVFTALSKKKVKVRRIAKITRARAADAVPGTVEYNDHAKAVDDAYVDVSDYCKRSKAAALVAKKARKKLAAMQAAGTIPLNSTNSKK